MTLDRKPDVPQAAIDLYDAYAHKTLDRRAFLDGLATLTGSAAAAAALLPLIEPGSASAQTIGEDDARLSAARVSVPGGQHGLEGYLAVPAGEGPFGAVLVVHENRGLNPHIEDIARRFAAEGFLALALDFLSPAGGTPQDPDQAREMIGTLSADDTLANALAALEWLRTHPQGNGRTGIIGFCWGGSMVNRVAVADAQLDAGSMFYGSAPDASGASAIEARLLLNYGELDERINAGMPAWTEALEAAGVDFQSFVYPGTQHAFFNDTSPARYDADAAALAWQRTLTLFRDALAG
ncbi:MAG: dienelactone hydrolase family protein [Caulobacterales bacterium]|uniref:dienelactone hydrolase family protein n=1 Tax=Glycocaulis sp. TaxID=1969725 RepID=UPI003FA030E2